jgi:hypothetical protein
MRKCRKIKGHLWIASNGFGFAFVLLPRFWKNWRLGQGLGQTLGI